MDVHVNIPEELARRLEKRWGDLSRSALEAIVVQAYREDVVTAAEVQQLLGLSSRAETDAFLGDHGAKLDYSEYDLAQDVAAIRKVRGE